MQLFPPHFFSASQRIWQTIADQLQTSRNLKSHIGFHFKNTFSQMSCERSRKLEISHQSKIGPHFSRFAMLENFDNPPNLKGVVPENIWSKKKMHILVPVIFREEKMEKNFFCSSSTTVGTEVEVEKKLFTLRKHTQIREKIRKISL